MTLMPVSVSSVASFKTTVPLCFPLQIFLKEPSRIIYTLGRSFFLQPNYFPKVADPLSGVFSFTKLCVLLPGTGHYPFNSQIC